MKISDIYSTCLKAADLNGQDLTVTIDGGEVRTLDDGKRKLLIKFRELQQPLLLNVTNARQIARLHGEEVTLWKGKQIILYRTVTMFGSREVDCIRVRDTVPVLQVALPQPTQPLQSGVVRF